MIWIIQKIKLEDLNNNYKKLKKEQKSVEERTSKDRKKSMK